jgi:hypothetical protein
MRGLMNSSFRVTVLVSTCLLSRLSHAAVADSCSFMFFRSSTSRHSELPSWGELLRLQRGESILVTSNDGRFPHIYYFIQEVWHKNLILGLHVQDTNGQELRIPAEKIKIVERAQPFFAVGERLRVQWIDKDGGTVTKEGAFKGLNRGIWQFEELTANADWSLSADLLRSAITSRRGGLSRLDPTFWSAKLALKRGEDKVEVISWQSPVQGVFVDEFFDRLILLRDRELFEIEKSKLMKVRRIREFTMAKSRPQPSTHKQFRPQDFTLRSGSPERRDEFVRVPEDFLKTGSFNNDEVRMWGHWVLALKPSGNNTHAAWVLGQRHVDEVTKNSYRILARRLSPDLNTERTESDQQLAVEIFKQINLAKDQIESSLGPLKP